MRRCSAHSSTSVPASVPAEVGDRIRGVGRGPDAGFDVLPAQAALPDDLAVLDDGRRHAGDTGLLPQQLQVGLEGRGGEGDGPQRARRQAHPSRQHRATCQTGPDHVIRPYSVTDERLDGKEPKKRLPGGYFPGAVVWVRSLSTSSITRFIFRIVRSSGSSVVMSTPASFSRSIGYFAPPEPRKVRYRFGGRRVAAQDLLRERRGGGEGRRVLEDVEVAVEVRDERPLVRHVVVHDADALVVAVVPLVISA